MSIINHISRAKGPYGELAEEFELIVNKMVYFGKDLRTAMWEVRSETPSEDFAELLDDLGAIMAAGSNLTPFMEDKTEEYHERSRRN